MLKKLIEEAASKQGLGSGLKVAFYGESEAAVQEGSSYMNGWRKSFEGKTRTGDKM